jgi:hypothetical protein
MRGWTSSCLAGNAPASCRMLFSVNGSLQVQREGSWFEEAPDSAHGEILDRPPVRRSAHGEILDRPPRRRSAPGEILDRPPRRRSAPGEILDRPPRRRSAPGDFLRPRSRPRSAPVVPRLRHPSGPRRAAYFTDARAPPPKPALSPLWPRSGAGSAPVVRRRHPSGGRSLPVAAPLRHPSGLDRRRRTSRRRRSGVDILPVAETAMPPARRASSARLQDVAPAPRLSIGERDGGGEERRGRPGAEAGQSTPAKKKRGDRRGAE